MLKRLLTQKRYFKHIYKDQKGITGLETAIILIAFVVVAAVFAYTVLSAGLFSTQKSQEAVYSGLQETQSTMELQGSVVGYDSTLNTNNSLGKVDITVSLSGNGNPVDLTPAYTIVGGGPSQTNANGNKLQIAFNDSTTTISDCVWTVTWIGKNNSDYLLDPGEKAVITVWMHSYTTAGGWVAGANPPYLNTDDVDTNHTFTLELKPAHGATMNITRTTPAYLDTVIDLH